MNELSEDDHVVKDISPADLMYKSDPDRYFLLGRLAMETIRRFRAVSSSPPVTTILDLPSGHGRVLRYLRAAFPDAVIAACDVDRDAVDFCARSFAAMPIYSTIDIEAIPLQGTYDLIWCGSLFTHIHADQWRALLQLFSAHLSDSGLLVFTSHGRTHADRLRSKRTKLGLSDWAARAVLSDYEHFGFGYQNYSGQDGYGISISAPSWVCSQIAATRGLRLVAYSEQGWAESQDAVACVHSRHD
jgi:SAM-dependent methyltransferase